MNDIYNPIIMALNQSNPIDDVIDQIDENSVEEENSCIKCTEQPDQLFKLSCNHLICIKCVESLIDQNEQNVCPLCHQTLTKNLCKLYSDFLANPVAKLSYYHDINVGDTLWAYGGNGHNWLYSKEHCDHLNDAHEQFQNSENNDHSSNSASDSDDSESDFSATELLIQTGNSMVTYIIDFDLGVQYPKNSPNRHRNIFSFVFNTAADLKTYKIAGVAGKAL